MKKWIHAVFFVTLIFSSTQCVRSQKTGVADEDRLRADLMQVHDEVMPRMGELTMLAGQVKEILKQDTLLPAETRGQFEATVREMEMAEEGMMDWMAGFRQPEVLRATMGHEQIMAYLNAEKDKITEVSVQIKSGIEKGKTIIGNYRKD